MLNTLWASLKGWKTYVVAVAMIIYGWYIGDMNTVLMGLGLMGLRNGVTSEVAKLMTK